MGIRTTPHFAEHAIGNGGAGVAEVHILQCDVEVTVDQWIEPEKLADYKIAGYGGSDMRPAISRLADDSEATAALVLTDGFIDVPNEEPPTVLWAFFAAPGWGRNASFHPGYGEVLFADP